MAPREATQPSEDTESGIMETGIIEKLASRRSAETDLSAGGGIMGAERNGRRASDGEGVVLEKGIMEDGIME